MYPEDKTTRLGFSNVEKVNSFSIKKYDKLDVLNYVEFSFENTLKIWSHSFFKNIKKDEFTRVCNDYLLKELDEKEGLKTLIKLENVHSKLFNDGFINVSVELRFKESTENPNSELKENGNNCDILKKWLECYKKVNILDNTEYVEKINYSSPLRGLIM